MVTYPHGVCQRSVTHSTGYDSTIDAPRRKTGIAITQRGPEVTSQTTTDNMLTRLRRIEGQVRGVQRMLEQNRECEDMLTQLMAIRSGIEQVGLMMMEVHLERCALGDLPPDSPQAQTIRDALRAWIRFGATISDRGESGATERG
jgi:DNA-binding FrmR family transcriptional regulator